MVSSGIIQALGGAVRTNKPPHKCPAAITIDDGGDDDDDDDRSPSP